MQHLGMVILAGFFDFGWSDPLRPDWDKFNGSHRTAFELFGRFEIRWYALIIMMAIVLSVIVGYFGFGKRLGLNSDLLSEGVIIGVLAGIIGARAWYVIADILKDWTSNGTYDTQFTSFGSIINLSSGGLAISGAVILVGICLYFYCRFRKIKILYLLEIVLPIVLLSQVVGRWGNFFNQEATGGLINVDGLKEALEKIASGELTSLPTEILEAQRSYLWFLPSPIVDRMYLAEEVALTSNMTRYIYGYYQPCFFYEGVLNLLGVILYLTLRRVIKKGIYVGDGISFYLIWYGIVRFFIESMRTDAQMIGNLRVVMIYTPVMVLGGLAWLIIRRVKKIQMITCYEALYGQDSTILLSENEIKTKKNKKSA